MATLDVIDLTEAKKFLDVANTTANDAELPLWISGVSQRLDRLVGPIVRRTMTAEKYHGGYMSIYLKLYPVYSITTVTEYLETTPVTLAPETNTSKPGDAYSVDPYAPDSSLLSNRLRRRYGGIPGTFVPGRLNVEVTYVAGRAANTASVPEKYKLAAGIMLKNAWRSQEQGTASMGGYDVPMSNFPTFAVPKFVREMLFDELQEPVARLA